VPIGRLQVRLAGEEGGHAFGAGAVGFSRAHQWIQVGL
jgi:hypothetical protein